MNHSRRAAWSTRFGPVLAAPLILLASPAHSQEQGATSQAGLEEVVVTAQKREEKLLDVPIAITAVTSQSMEDSGAAQLADFLQGAPGVGIIDDQSGTQSIQIRGISSTYGNAPVGYYLDELPFSYIGNTQVPDVRTYDLERVEILRGPQGTLYGDGSIGGTIRILTKDPSLDNFQAGADLAGSQTSGGDDNFAARGMLNVPLKEDTLALRVVGSKESFGGWVDDSITGADDVNDRDIDSYRAKLRWKAGEQLDLTLSAWHSRQEATSNSDSLQDRTTFVPADDQNTEYDLYSATVRYDFGRVSLVSATSVMEYSNDLLSSFFDLPFNINEDQDLFSQELRLTSNADGVFRWTGGVFYREIKRRTLVLLEAFNLTQDQTQKSDSYAVFGEGTLSLMDHKLDATIGVRYFEDDRLFREPVDPATLAFIQSLDPDFTGESRPTFHSFTPRFNLAWHPQDNWMVYGNIAKGFRTGQAQPIISLILAISQGTDIPSAVRPEELWSYEIGTKGTFAGGRASIEGAVYYNDWKDLQTLVVLNPQPRVAGLVNGGTARTAGAEVTLTVRPIERLSLQAGAGYVDAKYTEDIAGTPILDGDRIVGVPKITLSGSATYRWPLTTKIGGFAHAGLQHTSERTDIASAALPSDSMTTLDTRLGIESGSWSAYLFGDNLTDEDAAVDARYLGADGPATRLRPRTYGLNVRYNFN